MKASSLLKVDTDERLTRFILERNKVRADGTVRSAAFSPPKDLRLSVYRQLELSEQELWGIGEKYVAKREENRYIVGRADFDAVVVLATGLSCDPDGIPHPNHVNIIGWPNDKAERKNVEQTLADSAEFTPLPKPGHK
jgi:hypothetical protein